MARILLADDEEGIRSFVSEALALDGHSVTEATDGDQALLLLPQGGWDLLMLDLRMPGASGMEVLRRARTERPHTPVIVLTAHGTVATAVEAMKLGAADYLEKPPESLRALRALVRQVLRAPAPAGSAASADLPPLSYGDPAMVPAVQALYKVARTDAAVLLLGESGTGKEVAARTLHALSDRAAGPFVALNCAALSDALLESELFGHERGAFTGAVARHAGRLERAAGGTLFLDEVGELRAELQARLLRVLQERRYERVGGTQTLSADVRFVAATNRDLRRAMHEGRFREDLYHRLAVFPIHLSPLRERPRDIAPLARRLLQQVSADLGRPGLRLSLEAEARLQKGVWRGNVRELANVLQRAAVLCPHEVLSAADLDMDKDQDDLGAAVSPPRGTSLPDLEREAIEQALRECGGNRRRAAERLGIGLRTLYDKLKRYGAPG